MNRIEALEMALSSLMSCVHEISPPAIQRVITDTMKEWEENIAAKEDQ